MHLLKASAKPTATDRKRKKIALKGTFGEYKTSKQKPAPKNFVLNIPGVTQVTKPPVNAKTGKDAKMNE